MNPRLRNLLLGLFTLISALLLATWVAWISAGLVGLSPETWHATGARVLIGNWLLALLLSPLTFHLMQRRGDLHAAMAAGMLIPPLIALVANLTLLRAI